MLGDEAIPRPPGALFFSDCGWGQRLNTIMGMMELSDAERPADQAGILGGLVAKGSQDLSEGRPVRRGLRAVRCSVWRRYRSAKSLGGFGGRDVLEIVAPYDGDTFRAAYTVRFKDAIYVLHAFQKKSKKGISTPKPEIDLIWRRLADAARHYEEGTHNHGEEEER